MDDCTRFFNQIADLRLQNLEDEDQTELFAHLATCRDCRDLMQFHEDLAIAGDEFGEVDSEALAGVRGRVLDEIRSTEAGSGRGGEPGALLVGWSKPDARRGRGGCGGDRWFCSRTHDRRRQPHWWRSVGRDAGGRRTGSSPASGCGGLAEHHLQRGRAVGWRGPVGDVL